MSDLIPQLTQQFFNGLSLGAIYALIAIGYTMVYGIIGMINFAHGEIYMIGAYVGLVTLTSIGTNSGLPVPFIIAAMLLVAIVVTGIYGFSVERVAYRPVRNSPRLVALISAIGMSIFLQNWVALGQGARDMAVPSLVSGAVQFHMGSDFDVTVPYSRIMIIVVTVVLMVGLTLFIKYSRMGRASRLLAGHAHGQPARHRHQPGDLLHVRDGRDPGGGGWRADRHHHRQAQSLHRLPRRHQGLHGGGAGRHRQHPGAMLGGVLLGLAETFAAAYISSQYKDIVAFRCWS